MRRMPERSSIVIFIGFVLIILLFISIYHSGVNPIMIISTADCPKCQECPNQQMEWKSIDVDALTTKQMFDYFYWTNRSSCRLAHDFGGTMFRNPSGYDGQKAVCLDPPVAPKPDECIVYSFGVNNEWSFDDAMERYGCEVFSFDPSMNVPDHNRSDHVHFFNLGLGASDTVNLANGWKIRRLKTIYEDLKHTGRRIDYLKMDIEGGEWEALRDIIATGMLAKVRQLAVEVHFGFSMPLASYRPNIRVLKSIEDAGFHRFDSKYNPWSNQVVPELDNYSGPVCFEIAWYQANLNH